MDNIMSLGNSCADDECLLIELLEKATSSSGPWDAMARKFFCMLVKNNEELIGKAHELLVLKMYSANVSEALNAIELLQECMMVCGPTFQKKTAKFKFLNKLIEIVDEQRGNNAVALDVRKGIMECFLLWTVEYPDKIKIRECYEDLKRKVTFDHKTNMVKVTKRSENESILGKDEALVAKLLREGGPENFLAANLLIKNRVQLKNKHDEMMLEHKKKLQEIDTSLEVLNEMIENYSPDDNTDTMNLLFDQCLEYENQLKHICSLNLIQDDEKILAETNCTYGMLRKCLNRYSQVVRGEQCRQNNNLNLSNLEKLLQESDKDEAKISNMQLLSNILIPNSQEQTRDLGEKSIQKVKSTEEELSELFGNNSLVSTTETNTVSSDKCDFLTHFDPLVTSQTDISIGNCIKSEGDSINTTAKQQSENDESRRSSIKGMQPIDDLSEELFKHNLHSEKRQHTFKSSAPKKVTLKELAERDSNFSPSETDVNLKNVVNSAEVKQESLCKSLSSICIDLENYYLPFKDQRILIDDDHVKILAQFSSTHLYPNVSAIQLSAINKAHSFMNNLQFWVGVKKPCKVRLLPPTISNRSKCISLRPGLRIDQILLLLNTTEDNVMLTGFLQYKLDADPDPFTTPFICEILSKH